MERLPLPAFGSERGALRAGEEGEKVLQIPFLPPEGRYFSRSLIPGI
jgi:hypothetical protein